MVDNAQKVEIDAELDASATVSGARSVARELTKVIGQAQQLEQLTRQIFSTGGNLPRELQQFTAALEKVQKLPAQMAQVQRLQRQLSSGGPAVALQNASMQGVISSLRADPSVQLLRTEQEVNKVLQARGEIYRRIREVLPDDASVTRINKAYREALTSLGDASPLKGQDPLGYKKWLERTNNETRRFEQNWTRQAEIEIEKRNKKYLQTARQTMTEERRLQTEHQRELSRLFRRDMAGIMTGSTAEERRQMAGEAVQRLQGYAGRQGLTGFNERRLLDLYEDAEARRTARDMVRPPAAPRPTLNDRAGAAYAQRDAFMNYNGGANRIGSRFQFVGDFATVGAVMGTAMYAGRSTVTLQAELKQLQAITDATDNEMKSLQGTIFAVGQATRYSTQEIAQAATVMGQAGYSASQVRELLPAIANLATAAGGEINDTALTVTSVLSVFDLSMDRTHTVVNQMAEALNGSKLAFDQLALGLQYAGNVAADGGVQFEEMTAALGAMANAGIRSGSTLGTGLRALIRELANPNTKFTEWLTSVGLTAEDVDVRTQGLAGALKNLTSNSFDSAAAMNTFELRAAAAYSALSNNLDVMEDLQEDMMNTDAATRGAATQMESFTAQASRMANSLTEITTVAGAPFLAFLTGAIGATATFVSTVANAGPAVEILTTALAWLVTIQVGKWMIGLIAGFVGMTAGANSASGALLKAAIASGNLNLALGIATGGVRAFTVALLANPVTWVVAGLTALTTALTMNQAAMAKSTQRVEEYRTKANEAAAQTQTYKDRAEELTKFMGVLTARSTSLSGETNLVAQMAEQATAKFGDWGLVLEGNIKTIDQLIGKLGELRQEQAQAALAQANIQRDALTAERGEIERRNPWQAAQQASRQLFGEIGDPANYNAKVGYRPPQGWEQSIGLMNRSPEMMGLIQKLRGGGTLNDSERNRLVAWLGRNEAQFPPAFRAVASRLRSSIGTGDVNDLLKLEDQISRQERVISSLTVTSSDEGRRVGETAAIDMVRYRQEDREVNALPTAEARVARRAELDQQRHADRALRRMDLWNAAGRLASDPTVASGYARLAEAQGVSVQDIILQQLRSQDPQVSRLDAMGNIADISNDPDVLQTRKKMLSARLAEASQLTNTEQRNALQAQLRAQLTETEKQLYLAQNADESPEVQAAALANIEAGGAARGANTAETAAQRDARARASTLNRTAKGLERQIEIASGNTLPVAGTVGSTDEQRAMKFLMDKGLTAAQAAGIVGNLVHESGGMNTAALGDNGSAFGLAQWRGDRRSALDAFARGRGVANTDFNAQMEFLWQEMVQRGDLAAVQGQSTAAGAAEQFARKFERPAGFNGPLAGLAGWADRLSNANRLLGSGATQVDQSKLQGLLDQWKTTRIDQIKAEAAASNVSDEDLKQRLADFEMEASDFFTSVLSGNLVKTKQLMAEAAAQAADRFATERTNELAGDGQNLTDSIAQVQRGYQVAMQAAMDAADAEFRSKGLDPAVAQEAIAKRQEIQQSFAEKAINSTLEMIETFYEAERVRMDQETQRMQLVIDRRRAEISALSNTFGSRELSDVQRALGARRGEQLDVDEARLDVSNARGQLDIAVRERDAILNQIQDQGDPNGTLTNRLVDANRAVEEMRLNLERADIAFTAMTAKTPQFQSAAEAAAAAWQVFTDQQNLSQGVWEQVADGLLNTFTVAKGSFKSLVTDLVTGTKTMGDAFKDFTLSVLQSLLDLVAELMARQVLIWIIKMVASAGMGGGSGGMDAQGMAMLNGGNAYTSGNWLNGGMWHGGPIRARRMALGGSVYGSNPNRDSVLLNAMPGEFLMSKSAVDMVGEDTLRAMNAMANTRISAMPSLGMLPSNDGSGVVNVWVVAPDQKPSSIGKNDVLAYVSEDITTGGVTKRLIKQVVMGG